MLAAVVGALWQGKGQKKSSAQSFAVEVMVSNKWEKNPSAS